MYLSSRSWWPREDHEECFQPMAGLHAARVRGGADPSAEHILLRENVAAELGLHEYISPLNTQCDACQGQNGCITFWDGEDVYGT